ncbi:hypothetical protein RYA05_01165 [Pseudomonas syringae pv. actinidiae]|nr:hypothetical protein [Pseudomonas syringae pv. actinidiae]
MSEPKMRVDESVFDLIDRGMKLVRADEKTGDAHADYSAKALYALAFVEQRMTDARKGFNFDDHRAQEQITGWVEDFIHDSDFNDTMVVNGMRFDIAQEGAKRRVVAGNNDDQILAEIFASSTAPLDTSIKVEIHPEWSLIGCSKLESIDFEGQYFRTAVPIDPAEALRLSMHMYSKNTWSR